MKGPFIWRTLLLSFLFHAALWAADSPFIQTLQIRGTRRALEIETRSGQALDLVRIEHDVRRLWATGWFDDIRVESSPSVEGVQLVFTLTEKPRLYLRRVEFDPENEQRPLGLEKGMPVDAVLAKRVAAALRQQLVERGHPDATVEAGVIPVGFQQADLRVRVERGRDYRVQEVRFSGSLGLKPKELRGALRATRAQRLLPGVGPLWRGWRLLAPLSQQRLQADVERLQSLYLSRGYFDARVGIATVDAAEDKATVTVQVDAGRRYHVERLEVVGAESIQEIPPQPDGTFPSRKLCQFLLEARRKSEREGRFGFTAMLEVRTTSEPLRHGGGTDPKQRGLGETGAVVSPWVALKAKIETGTVYRVGRIEFRGHHAVGDSTLRRALLLQEGDLFDEGRLRRSLARLSQFALLEPVVESDVHMKLAPEDHRVDLSILVKEKPRGRWSFSGPLGPVSAFGHLQFTIGSRLPSLGYGPLELSTYHATISLLALSSPLAGLLSLVPQTDWQPLFALERPYLPGQRWQSGFLLSPQLGWRGTLSSYGLAQARQTALTALGTDSPATPAVFVPARWSSVEGDNNAASFPAAGILRCEPRKSSLAWLQAAGTMAANWLLSVSPL